MYVLERYINEALSCGLGNRGIIVTLRNRKHKNKILLFGNLGDRLNKRFDTYCSIGLLVQSVQSIKCFKPLLLIIFRE